jgi:Protein of unknown function (DUF1759)
MIMVAAATISLDIRRRINVLKQKFKKFSGDLKEWISFWSQFKKIHEDAELHDSDKFQYLVQSVVPGTRAHKLVTSYPQSTAHCPLFFEALKDRFGDITD